MAKRELTLSKYRKTLNSALRIFFMDALRITLRKPLQAAFFCRTIRRLQTDARKRAQYAKVGVQVPPIIIFSITNRCNLECENCYQQALHPSPGKELSEEEIGDIIAEAKQLGVSFFVIAGGEPFLRGGLLDITREFSDMLFLVFTNGLLIDLDAIARIKKQRNLILLVSLEGHKEETDSRRGKGVHEHIEMLIPLLRKSGNFFGISLTITRKNFSTLTDYGYIQNLSRKGCRFFLFLEYTPVLKGTEKLVLSGEQRATLMERLDEFHRQLPALFIAVPGHEESVGGCLAAGRGFVHITAEGDVEPCPFAPFSDRNVKDNSLKAALQSDLLDLIRKHPEKLQISQGGCCLWKQRKWIYSNLKQQ